jgi:tetratricopeptide (TPR) repeat protein
VTARSPTTAEAWLLQGALQIEMADPKAAQASLLRFVELRQEAAPRADEEAASADEGDDEDGPSQAGRDIQQAYLMLAQTAEQQKDYAGAQAWLEKVGDALASPAVAQRRASLLARQGRLDEGVALLHKLPERTPDETRGKALALAQVLRDGKRWQSAYEVLSTANDRLNDDADLLYEQALLAEKLARFDEMEGLLRRVMVLKPDQQHAYNALGYSLADRGLRLREARELIARALELAPGDPFIADSMGWVEFKLGRLDEALRLLRGAFKSRPDTEIAAHLGEVLWAAGLKDEARQVWRSGREKDDGNDVLKETLARLKVAL